MRKIFFLLFLILTIISSVFCVHADNDYYLKGFDLSRQGDFEEALDALNQQIAIDDKSCIVWAMKALVLYKLERYDEAKDAIETEFKLNHFNESTTAGLIEQIALVGQFQLGFSEKDSESFKNQMNDEFEKESESSEISQPILNNNDSEINENSADKLSGKAEAYFSKEDFSTALGYVDDAINLNSKNPEYWALKGDILHGMGKNEDAIVAYNHAITLHPDYFYVQLKLEDLKQKGYVTILNNNLSDTSNHDSTVDNTKGTNNNQNQGSNSNNNQVRSNNNTESSTKPASSDSCCARVADLIDRMESFDPAAYGCTYEELDACAHTRRKIN